MNPLESLTTQPIQANIAPNKDNPFSPKGRFSRLSYLAWMFIVGMLYTCTVLIVAGVAGVAFFKAGMFNPSVLLQTSLGYFTIFLFFIVIFAFTVISICISIRRLHDLNKSGWLWLLFLIPFINIIFGIYIMCAKGTAGDNKYGPERATEQTEKLLGTLYAVFLAVFIVFYGAITIWMVSAQNSMVQEIESMQMSESDHPENLEEYSEDSAHLIESAPEEYEEHESEESSQEDVNSSAEEAVRAANEAADAAENQITHEANQR